MQIILAAMSGFCDGVARAIDMVNVALQEFGPPVYVYREIIHNQHVLHKFKAKGVVFVWDVYDVPCGSVLIFPAHGVPNHVKESARALRLHIVDATCPIVSNIHSVVRVYERQGKSIVLIGHKMHEEVRGIVGCVDSGVVHVVEDVLDVLDLPQRIMLENTCGVAYVTQTTFNTTKIGPILAALKAQFPLIEGVLSICNATKCRQDAVKKLAHNVDVMLIVGSSNSSNSNRLTEIGNAEGTPSYLLCYAEQIEKAWFEGAQKIGIASGASTPEYVVQDIVKYLCGVFIVDAVSTLAQ